MKIELSQQEALRVMRSLTRSGDRFAQKKRESLAKKYDALHVKFMVAYEADVRAESEAKERGIGNG
jgi:hypothetical protein